jgi:hypothetical protein
MNCNGVATSVAEKYTDKVLYATKVASPEVNPQGAATSVAEEYTNRVPYATEVASPEIKPCGAATLVAENIDINKNLLGLGYAV